MDRVYRDTDTWEDIEGLFNLMDPWKELSRNTFSKFINNKILSIGADWYQVVFIIGVVGLTISLILMGISLIFRRRGTDIAMAKEDFMIKVCIAIFIFIFPTIFGLVYPVFESLGK